MKKAWRDFRKYLPYAVRSAKAELKSEVTGSKLGWLWWIVEPLGYMFIYTFVFSVVFPNRESYFPAFIMVGVSCWEFFNRMITGSIKLVANNRDLISKAYIPKYILLLSKAFVYLFKMLISLGLTLTLAIILGVSFSPWMLLALVIISVLFIVTFGLSMILMHFGVYIEDLKNATKIILRLVFYLSGVFYNINTRLEGAIKFFLLRCNPVAFSMSEMRKVMLYGAMPSFEGLAIWLVIGIILCAIGFRLIIKYENSYAKVV